jgi:hypothetical protein
MPNRYIPRELKELPAVRFNRLCDLEQRWGERRKRAFESNNVAGMKRALRWEEKIQAALMVSAPFDVATYGDFSPRP